MLISDGINHGKLQSIIVGELKKAGLKHRLKKIILKNVKDHKTVFGAPLLKVPSCSVICCGSTLCIPTVVSEMSSVLRSNAHIEGLFRKAGSQSRQKDIKRLLDAGGCVSEGHHPIDVASVLKLYLRCLPEPLISAEVQDLLLRCRVAGEDGLKSILNTLLLLPVLHVHLLHYVMELLNYIASKHKENLMDSSNLAIVLAPSIMPLPATSTAQRLEHHVALVKIFIENSKHIGLLTDDLMTRLDDDSDVSQSRRKKRRSGSLNRMLSGLRKMVSGNATTPAPVFENSKTPILSKSAAKRKFDNNYEGLSVKTKKEIKNELPQKELSFTPMKMAVGGRKRLRLSFMDSRSTPVINSDFSSHKNSETSISSEDLLTSSENLFSAHDTIDLSPYMKDIDKDYVRISKQEYEEIKSRVSAIENRLSREFTDVIPRAVQPLQQVQNVYEQTLEEVAMLNCPNSEHLARRLSKELKIRPKEQAKIIRSPSARKIGSIRRRSKENLTKIVRHKSWNASTHSQVNPKADRFNPYIGLIRRERTSTIKPNQVAVKGQNSVSEWNSSFSENSTTNASNSSQKYRQRKRISLAPDYNLNKTIGKTQTRRSLNVTINNSWDGSESEKSTNTTMNSKGKSRYSDQFQCYQNIKSANQAGKEIVSNSKQKWRNAAAFFIDKTGELETSGQNGRPSVNNLRRQNAGAVLAKAKLFESSSDKSSEHNEKAVHSGFARKPRVNPQQIKTQKTFTNTKSRLQPYNSNELGTNSANKIDKRSNDFGSKVTTYNSSSSHKKDELNMRQNRKITPIKKVVSPQSNFLLKTPQPPALKKSLCTPRNLRTPSSTNELKRNNIPMKAVHISPRRSPRQKQQRAFIN